MIQTTETITLFSRYTSVLGNQSSEDGHSLVRRHGHGEQQCSNNAPLVVRATKCASKLSPPPLNHHHQRELQGMMELWMQIV